MRTVLAIGLVLLAAFAGELIVLASFHQVRRLSVATVRLSLHPGRRGAMAVYVPLVDWGVRFDVVRLPVELQLDVRSIDRAAVEHVARNQQVDLEQVRAQARNAIASYVRAALALALAGGLLAGTIVALAVRTRMGPRVRWLLASGLLASAGVAACAPLSAGAPHVVLAAIVRPLAADARPRRRRDGARPSTGRARTTSTQGRPAPTAACLPGRAHAHAEPRGRSQPRRAQRRHGRRRRLRQPNRAPQEAIERDRGALGGMRLARLSELLDRAHLVRPGHTHL